MGHMIWFITPFAPTKGERLKCQRQKISSVQGKLTLSTQLVKPNNLDKSLPTQHYSFNLKKQSRVCFPELNRTLK